LRVLFIRKASEGERLPDRGGGIYSAGAYIAAPV